ncbi:thioredoxin-disulfide reductase [Tissierella creatinophila]|uniref:Thioredoxin reductase n=1 Tax=Tissierella creatinophila DSM 6911 TaxID=1123403 RepID=A0A1U7M940_TISCR|nr:thioredoxin-disulfide reductase [Tissierella creatinophila]OLS03854.1 thioredoxin reductase [Tissierella creatinophila DSM 6911]
MIYDVIIIGGGPAGLSAGLYAARARMSTLIIEKDAFGGQIVTTSDVENYPGSMESPTGPILIDRMIQQAEGFGAKKVSDTIVEVNFNEKIKVVKGEKEEYKAKTVIVATGAVPRPMGCPGEKELTGRGVSYCATCDGAFFEDLEVYVVGGGDSAVEEAMFLTKFARKVTIVHRRSELRAAKSIQEKAFKNEKLDFIWDSAITEVKGEGILESFILKNLKTGEEKEIVADEDDGTFGIFVFVGYLPATSLFTDKLDMERDYLVTDENMHTNVDGVFAAGDVRAKSLRQVVTATADGAIAAVQAEKYIEDNFED